MNGRIYLFPNSAGFKAYPGVKHQQFDHVLLHELSPNDRWAGEGGKMVHPY
jgi:hypothetical protein